MAHAVAAANHIQKGSRNASFFASLAVLLGLGCLGQAQIIVDLEACAIEAHHLSWGLGSEHSVVKGLELLENESFAPQEVCLLEHTTEVEGGYLHIRCRFPTRYGTFQADEEFDIRLGDDPLTAYQALSYCERLGTGNVLLGT